MTIFFPVQHYVIVPAKLTPQLPSSSSLLAMAHTEQEVERQTLSAGDQTSLLNHFDPDAKPFEPSLCDVGAMSSPGPTPDWQVVAAEFGGKAVAVLVDPVTFQVHVCTSPHFNSKCVHPDLSCLDWDSVVFDPDMCCTEGTRETSLASQSPLPGLDNFHDSGYENMTDNSSEVSAEIFNPTYYHPPVPSFYQPIEVYTPSDGLEQQSMLAPSPNSPLVQYVPWVTQQDQFETVSSDVNSALAGLSLESNGDIVSLDTFGGGEKRDDSKDDQIRDAFKKKVLTNIKADEEEKEYEEKKKRRAFKKQIMDNLKNNNNN